MFDEFRRMVRPLPSGHPGSEKKLLAQWQHLIGAHSCVYHHKGLNLYICSVDI